jgi:two-component system CheB/CheR fusion protein
MPSDRRARVLDQLVVVGSSAGGVEAVTELLGGLAADFAAPIVIAQHLNPSRRSHLEEILRRRSPLPVRIAASGDRLEPGTVYIVPADRDVEIEGDRFALHEPRERRRPVPSIDLLLRSGARAVGHGLAESSSAAAARMVRRGRQTSRPPAAWSSSRTRRALRSPPGPARWP